MKILKITGHEIYDSRGWPTLQTVMQLSDGSIFTGYAPSGYNTTSYEMPERRDGEKRFWGKGVAQASELISTIVCPALVGKEPHAPDLDHLLMELDNIHDAAPFGSNVLTATSMALYKAYAHKESLQLYELFAHLTDSPSVTLPSPQFNIINGGKHAESNLSIQEFIVTPIGAPTLREAIETCVTLFHELKGVLRRRGKFFGIGEEGGFTAQFRDDREALDIVVEALEKTSNAFPATLCALALDVAATQLYDVNAKKYIFQNQSLSPDELINFYEEILESYPIYSIEDGMSENDIDGWRLMGERFGEKIQIAGDEIFSSNPDRLAHLAVETNINSVVIKPNQIGTITETLHIINLCASNQLNTILSCRSGETEDPFLADLAVGISASQFKAGGCCRSERMAKYNRLLEIEDELLALTGSI